MRHLWAELYSHCMLYHILPPPLWNHVLRLSFHQPELLSAIRTGVLLGGPQGARSEREITLVVLNPEDAGGVCYCRLSQPTLTDDTVGAVAGQVPVGPGLG